MIECLALSLATLALTGGCSENPSGEDGMPRVKVGFAAPDIEPAEGVSAAAAPGSKAALADKTTVRVIVFRPNSGTPSSANYIAEQTYYMNGNKLVPCTVNGDGSFKAANTDGELSLPASRYDFFAVTPALPLNADHMTVANVPNGVDFAMSVTANVAVDTDRTVTLTQLARKCANMNIVVQNAVDNASLTAVSVTSNGNGVRLGKLAPAQSIVIGNKDFTPASGTMSFTVAPASFTVVSATKMTGSVALLPRLGASRMSFSFDLTYTVSGTATRSTFTGTVGNLVLEKGKAYTLTLTMKQSGASLTVSDWRGVEQTEEMGSGEGIYPYIGAGKFVVSKDDKGSIPGPMHPKWSAENPMPAHDEKSENNRMGEIIELYYLPCSGGWDGADIRPMPWANAVEACSKLPGGNWRLPTLEEVCFIFRRHKYSYFYGLEDYSSRDWNWDYPMWASTHCSTSPDDHGKPWEIDIRPGTSYDDTYAWSVNVRDNIGELGYMIYITPKPKTDMMPFRCVRDVN